MAAQDASYRVVYSQYNHALLQTYVDVLLQAGWDKDTLAALLQRIDDRLKRSPADFGEPLYTLRNTNLKVSIGFVRPFAVNFGLREDIRTVFVGKLVLMTMNRL